MHLHFVSFNVSGIFYDSFDPGSVYFHLVCQTYECVHFYWQLYGNRLYILCMYRNAMLILSIYYEDVKRQNTAVNPC